nr:piggyBac transposable element-derived protein 1-like [Parasteatoda tepidariorum]
MYIKGKPVKFGYKLWILTSFDGYSFHIIPYQEAQQYIESEIKKEKMSLSQMVVENLLSIGETPAKHNIYMDNFFTSYDLFVTLKRKTFVTGTVRENRIGKNFPSKSPEMLGKIDRGTSDRKFDSRNEIAK